MPQSKIETLIVSIPAAPPGLPPKVRERLVDLGIGKDTSREDVRTLIGSEPAANMFLAKGASEGWLVPVAWNKYRIPNAQVLQVLGRIANPLHRRLVSWAAVLPNALGQRICFVGPRLLRDTDLSIDDLLPVVPLKPDERTVAGLPPQLDAFYQDLIDPAEKWKLESGQESLAEFLVPSATDTALLLVASLDPRWRYAYHQLPGTSSQELGRLVSKIDRPQEAPRGNKTVSIGAGPPHRLRLLVPKWYLENMLNVTRESIFHEVLGGRSA